MLMKPVNAAETVQVDLAHRRFICFVVIAIVAVLVLIVILVSIIISRGKRSGLSERKIILLTCIVLIMITAVTATSVFLFWSNGTFRTVSIENYNGDIGIIHKDKAVEVYKGMQLHAEDEASTGEASSLTMIIDTDKHIIADENTSFRLEMTGDEKKGTVRIILDDGGTLIRIDNKLNPDSAFKVATPNATMSVRGTIFSVRYDSGNQTTVVFVEEGSVHVTYGYHKKEDVVAGGLLCIKEDKTVEITSVYPEYNVTASFGDYIDNLENASEVIDISGSGQDPDDNSDTLNNPNSSYYVTETSANDTVSVNETDNHLEDDKDPEVKEAEDRERYSKVLAGICSGELPVYEYAMDTLYYTDNPDECVYAYADIDGDGTDELFTSRFVNHDFLSSIEMYYYVDGSLKHVLVSSYDPQSYDIMGGYEDGKYVYNNGDWEKQYTFWFDIEDENYITQIDAKTDKQTEITPSDYDAMFRNYVDIEGLLEGKWKPLSE